MADLQGPAGLLSLSDGELARLVHDSEQRDQAREVLVYRYRSIVQAVAHHYTLPAQHYEDLVQVGYVGLMKAINNFNPAIREDLNAYATACVSGEIKRFFRDKRWLMRVSRKDQELLLAAKRALDELTAELGSAPTDEQVASRLDVSTDDLRRAYQAHAAFAPGSLDAPVRGSDDLTAGELLGSEDTRIDHAVDMDAVRVHWGELPRVQRQILLMRYYGNMTQQQVADRLHCSQMHVSRLQTRALAFLRARLLAEEPVSG